ncbi:MAG: hypothetical protein H7258_04715 [Ferruginibacter sp.]|nr:hypothetical protein [Ferruginibacter sp.]
MLKVTLIFSLPLFFGCYNPVTANDELYRYEQELNKDAEKRIDAAYINISKHCDSLFTYELPLKVDSLLKTDALH